MALWSLSQCEQWLTAVAGTDSGYRLAVPAIMTYLATKLESGGVQQGGSSGVGGGASASASSSLSSSTAAAAASSSSSSSSSAPRIHAMTVTGSLPPPSLLFALLSPSSLPLPSLPPYVIVTSPPYHPFFS